MTDLERARLGLVVLLTGLPGSGKSTLAERLRDLVLERTVRTVSLLDGDGVRPTLSAELGFARPDRETHTRRIGYVATEIARHKGVAICSVVAPYAESRGELRWMVEDADGTFVLVHVSTPLEECERRRESQYAMARAGQIPIFTGISDPYEEPTDAEIVIDTTTVDIDDAAARLFQVLAEAGLLTANQT